MHATPAKNGRQNTPFISHRFPYSALTSYDVQPSEPQEHRARLGQDPPRIWGLSSALMLQPSNTSKTGHAYKRKNLNRRALSCTSTRTYLEGCRSIELMNLPFKPVRASRVQGFQGPYGGSQLVLTLYRIFFFCFQMCNRLPELMKNRDAGIFPVYYSFELIKMTCFFTSGIHLKPFVFLPRKKYFGCSKNVNRQTSPPPVH